MRTVPWSEGVESRLWRWEEGVGQEDMEMVGVDDSFRTFGCGGLNTDEAAGTGRRTVEGGGFVVFKDGSHPGQTILVPVFLLIRRCLPK